MPTAIPRGSGDEAPRSSIHREVAFLVLPHVHLLDLAGPSQVFFEANAFGASYSSRFCAATDRVVSAQGPVLADLAPLPTLESNDLVVVPGTDSRRLGDLPEGVAEWLQECHAAGTQVCSICTSAYVLGEAGLLAGRQCTTHWRQVRPLQRRYPSARVLENRLFVRDGAVCTSAGVASGIDLALWLVERDHGPLVAARVAREIVVYLRRDGSQEQRSLYLEHRTHLHAGVHRVQDWLINHPEKTPTLEELAETAGMSSRNLTRVFKKATGTTLKTFSTALKVEFARSLLRDPELTVEAVSAQCGFADARQLRTLWRRSFGVSPSEWRRAMTDPSPGDLALWARK